MPTKQSTEGMGDGWKANGAWNGGLKGGGQLEGKAGQCTNANNSYSDVEMKLKE